MAAKQKNKIIGLASPKLTGQVSRWWMRNFGDRYGVIKKVFKLNDGGVIVKTTEQEQEICKLVVDKTIRGKKALERRTVA